MLLGDLIALLQAVDPNRPVQFGFGKPHSYRGIYAELAFEPVPNTTAGAMLTAAQNALNSTYVGYKGGEFLMDEWVGVWLAEYGDIGDAIGLVLLRFLLGMEQELWRDAEVKGD